MNADIYIIRLYQSVPTSQGCNADEAAAVEAVAVLAAAGVAMHPLHMADGEAFPHAADTEVATGAAPEVMLHTKENSGMDLTAMQENLLEGSGLSLLALTERGITLLVHTT